MVFIISSSLFWTSLKVLGLVVTVWLWVSVENTLNVVQNGFSNEQLAVDKMV